MNAIELESDLLILLHLAGGSYLEIARKCDAIYECPKDKSTGKRLGPLVGYAGKYDDEHQYVGDLYLDFSKIETHPQPLVVIAEHLYNKLQDAYNEEEVPITGFCGAPEGGRMLADALSVVTHVIHGSFSLRSIFAQKEKVADATATSRKKTKLFFERHLPEPGEEWWIVEDVCNNFSTTQELIDLIKSYGASVGGILCYLNRSVKFDDKYVGPNETLRILSAVREPMPEYRQDDPAIIDDIKAGNVVWKPRAEWKRLKQFISKQEAAAGQ